MHRATDLRTASLLTFAFRIGSFFCAFATSVLLSRLLGPVNRGAYSLIVLIVSVMPLVGTLGIDIANVHFSASRKYDQEDVASNAVFTGLGLGTATLFLLWFVGNTGILNDYLESSRVPKTLLWTASFCLPSMFLSRFLSSTLLGRQRILTYNMVTFSQLLLHLSAVVFFLRIMAGALAGAVVAYTVSILSSTLIVFLVSLWRIRIKMAINLSLLRASVRYGVKGYFGNLFQFLNYRLDLFLIAYYLDAASVGYYAVAVAMAESLWMIPDSLATILFPKVSASNQRNEIRANTALACSHSFFLLLLCSGMMCVIGRPLVAVFFGEPFLPAATPLLLLLPGIILLGTGKALSASLAGLGRPEYSTLAAAASFLFNLPANMVLIPLLGIPGAALASSISYGLAFSVLFAASSRIIQVTWKDLFLIRSAELRGYLFSLRALGGFARSLVANRHGK